MTPKSTRTKSKKKVSFLWVTDPWETLDHEKDTTLLLAREAARLGYESWWADVRSIRMDGNVVLVDAALVDSNKADPTQRFCPLQVVQASSFSSVHYRVDPPVDLAYIHPLQLLVLAKAKVVNPASVLLSHNEKLEAGFLPELMPEGLVSSQWEALSSFGRKHQKTVLKPLHQAQSKGVMLLDWRSKALQDECREKLSQATQNFTSPVMLQRFLPGIVEGEQRLWFLDGELLACVRKMPLAEDFRVNIDQGSALRKTQLSPTEKASAKQIGGYLKKTKIRLAAVDLIEGYITDFNFTSPGLITQMEGVLNQALAAKIVRKLARN